MLHELLVALIGYTGDLIIDEREERLSLGLDVSQLSSESTFKLAPDISFIDPSERDAIQALLPLGFYYRRLDQFAVLSRNLSWIRSTNQPSTVQKKAVNNSVCRRAIASGIVEILSVYRSAVLQIEQHLLSDPVPLLATLTQGLNKFHILLRPLYEFILEVEQKDIRGGQLLSLLHNRCHCGAPELQSCFRRLLWHGHQVMYNQLSSWLVYGILQDQHAEFFIRRHEEQVVDNELGHQHKFDGAGDGTLSDWHHGFYISSDMLPDYIPMHLAESILFSGKAVMVLRNPGSFATFHDSASRPWVPRVVNKLHSLAASSGYCKELYSHNKLGAELLPQFKADKIERMLHDLKVSSEFDKRSFEAAVGFIRTIAASCLWQLVVVCADLIGHLKAMKDFFLLAKGDFFQCFLEESRQLMRLPPRQSTAEADLLTPFQMAAVKTIIGDDEHFQRLTLRLSFVAEQASQLNISKASISDGHPARVLQGWTSLESFPDGWDDIVLEYLVDWPLQLFFTREVFLKYQRVFKYLLRLKRTQMELDRLWASDMHHYHVENSKNRTSCDLPSWQCYRHSRPMWWIREHMAVLIRNLQFYIQVDVIESQWNIFHDHFQQSHDFSELVCIHDEYLSALISQSFLDIGSVCRIVDSLMKLCLQFCWLSERQQGHEWSPELEKVTEEFNKKSNSLYTILRSSKLAGSQRAPYLRQFLLRLNFNSFFEVTAKGVLNVST